MRKRYAGMLLMGIPLGILVALPVTAMDSSWPSLFGGDKGMARQLMPSDSPKDVTSSMNAGSSTVGASPEADDQPYTGVHPQTHEMMDVVHGPGTSQRMYRTMGPDAEKMMDQCAAMMNMMDGMSGMGSMQGMMGAEGTRGMMGE